MLGTLLSKLLVYLANIFYHLYDEGFLCGHNANDRAYRLVPICFTLPLYPVLHVCSISIGFSSIQTFYMCILCNKLQHGGIFSNILFS